MEFNYKQFLTENKLTSQSRVKSLFERDQSDEHESFSTEIESELDEMLNNNKIDAKTRKAAQIELEKNIGDYYSTYQVHNFSTAIEEIISDAEKNLNFPRSPFSFHELKSNNIKINEEQSVEVNGKPVDINSIEVGDVYTDDYPDFVDATAVNATFEDGTELSADELSELTENYPELINELAYESLLEGKEEEDDEFQDEPSSKDIKASKGTDALANKNFEFANIMAKLKPIISKYSNKEINLDQYKEMAGNMPNQLKKLKADIEALELNEADNYEDLTLKMNKFKKALDKYEDHQLKTMLVELAWKETTIEKLIDSVLEFENINN